MVSLTFKETRLGEVGNVVATGKELAGSFGIVSSTRAGYVRNTLLSGPVDSPTVIVADSHAKGCPEAVEMFLLHRPSNQLRALLTCDHVVVARQRAEQ